MVKQTWINIARVGVNRDMIIRKESRSPRVGSHHFGEGPINKAPNYVTEQLGCEHDSLSSYEPQCHNCQEYAARK